MEYRDLFAKIYIKHGKKSFQDGDALLELVKEADPDIENRQFVVIDYLTRKNNFSRLMESRFLSDEEQEEVIDQIAKELNNDFYVPLSQTRQCAAAFLSVFQHGSRKALKALDDEYNESMAPTTVMEAINVDVAPLLEEQDDDMDTQSIHISKSALEASPAEEEWADQLGDLEYEEEVYVPSDLVEEADKPKQEVQIPQPETTSSKPKKKTKMKKISSKPMPKPKAEPVIYDEDDEEEETKKESKGATILLVILLLLLVICVGLLFFYLKVLNIF
jgi:cobalamin biosynthesis Mg chelatase CobN